MREHDYRLRCAGFRTVGPNDNVDAAETQRLLVDASIHGDGTGLHAARRLRVGKRTRGEKQTKEQ
jgi:hypothetical protein